MRSFYTNPSGCTADLCQMTGSDETRLVIHDASGHEILREFYPYWHIAIEVLRSTGNGWINDLTHEPLT